MPRLFQIPSYFEAAGLSKKSLWSQSPKTDMVSMDSKGVVLEIGHAKKTDAETFEEAEADVYTDDYKNLPQETIKKIQLLWQESF